MITTLSTKFDNSSSEDRLNDTNIRVQSEFDDNDKRGFAWVTQGREVENYVAPEVLEAAVKAVRPGYGCEVKHGQFERCLPSVESGSAGVTPLNKVRVAHEVASQTPDLSILDLEEQIGRLVTFIRMANELD